jgi:hypothetical protein
MSVKVFRHGYRNGWEIDLVGKRWNLRIARHQIALWRDYHPVFDRRF